MRLSERIRIVIVLSVGLLAIALLTWGVGKIYLELIGRSGAQASLTGQGSYPDAAQLTEPIMVLPEVAFWTCQIGVFQMEENAYGRKEQLKALNVEAEVFGSDPWTVGTGWAASADGLKELAEELAAQGVPTIPKQIVLPERSFRVAGNFSQLTRELLTNVNTILREGLTAEALADERQVWSTWAGDHPPKELEALHEIFERMREQTAAGREKDFVFSLFFESQRVINALSGK